MPVPIEMRIPLANRPARWRQGTILINYQRETFDVTVYALDHCLLLFFGNNLSLPIWIGDASCAMT